MSDHYHDPSDSAYARQLRKGAPDAFTKLMEFDDAALRAESKVIPAKYTELMALAVGLTTQCVYCIEAHTLAAKKAGATREEISETVLTAAALRAGGAVAHGFLAMKFFEKDSE
ncbi:MAG: carboxymuconolactone decarboxylase family protein [Leucobacter sp.]